MTMIYRTKETKINSNDQKAMTKLTVLQIIIDTFMTGDYRYTK